ncbi:MAG: DUF4824 family protein, partial [Pseudomonadota bacterium]|nr:DUF4824 family protein [Pseudomonadota bacterium]
MKLSLSQTRALLAGIALIVLTNAVVLAGVAYNRSGEPESVLRLTERELRLGNWNWPANENSSIDVHLSWRVARAESDDDVIYGGWQAALSWLKPAQLGDLGFDVGGDIETAAGAERVRKQPSRRAWVVLEHDGPAYQASLARARQRLERATALANANAGDSELQDRLSIEHAALEHEKNGETRLFVVDVGRDENALRARYPDRRRYAIVDGRLRLMIEGKPGRSRLTAQVIQLHVDEIRVPHTYRELVEPLVQPNTYTSDRNP